VIRTTDLASRLRDSRPAEPPSAELRPRRPYPDGWFAVAFTEELSPGRMLRRRFMGEELVVYRTRRGLVRAVEPYCPHLGAHLGHGGWVDGEDIVCPFHHFAFDTDGMCVRTGYGTRPPAARLVRREVREVNGAVLVWHHAGGVPPTWEVAPQDAAAFPAPFRQLSVLVDHPQDVVENAVDLGHIGPVHGYRNVRLRRRFTPHGPSFAIAAAGERQLPFGGRLGIEFDIVVHGLGHLWVDAAIPRLSAAAKFQAMATPIDPCRVELRYSVALRVGEGAAHAHTWALASRLLTGALGPLFRRDMERDFPIWEHKVYVERPRLAKGDGPLPEFRRWARQFYSAPATTDASAARRPELSVVR